MIHSDLEVEKLLGRELICQRHQWFDSEVDSEVDCAASLIGLPTPKTSIVTSRSRTIKIFFIIFNYTSVDFTILARHLTEAILPEG
jgi:hypothetical protein